MNEFLDKYRLGDTNQPTKPEDFTDSYLAAPEAPNSRRSDKSVRYYQLDETAKESLQKVAELTSLIFEVQSVLISVIDEKVQYSFQTVNFDIPTIPVEQSFCGHAILTPDSTFVVPDATRDWRFQNNPLVKQGLRFYAGSPIKIAAPKLTMGAKDEEMPIGAVCLVDNAPHPVLTDVETSKLQIISSLVRDLMDLHLLRLKIADRDAMSTSILNYIKSVKTNIDHLRLAESSIKGTLRADCIISPVESDACYFEFPLASGNPRKIPYDPLNPIWEDSETRDNAILLAFDVDDERYMICVFAPDKSRVFDIHDVSYVAQFTQSISVVLQQSMVQKANATKSTFIQNVSHELRTPLHGILSSTELLQEDNDLTAEQKGLITMIQSSGKNVINVINSLLDFNRFESEEIRVSEELFNIFDMHQDVLESFAISRKSNCDLLLETDIPWTQQCAVADPSLMKQVLLNIVDNAVKFTDRGSVSVRCSLKTVGENAQLIWTVRDTGRGMTEAFVKDGLFKPFVKENSFTQGTGLGLSISRRIAKATSSALRVVFSKPGEGTVIEFALPVKMESDPTSSVLPQVEWRYKLFNETFFLDNVCEQLSTYFNAQADPKNGKLLLIDYDDVVEEDILKACLDVQSFKLIFCDPDVQPLISDLILHSPHVFVCTKPVGVLKLQKIFEIINSRKEQAVEKKSNMQALIVDDNSINRNMLAMYCKKRKIKYETATDGLEAFSKFKAKHFDIVFMDIQMPTCDGPSAVKMIRQYERTRNFQGTLIIMLTGLSTDVAKEQSFEHGANGFYIKPVSMKTLDLLISSL